MSNEALRSPPQSPVHKDSPIQRILNSILNSWAWTVQWLGNILAWLEAKWGKSGELISSKEHVYHSLTGISLVLVIINIVEVFKMEYISSHKYPLIWLILLPGGIILFWILIMLRCCRKYFKDFRAGWPNLDANEKKTYKAKIPARVGIFFGTIIAVAICQLLFMPLYVLPQFQKVIWTVSYDTTGGLAAPLLVFSALWGDKPSPDLSFEVYCTHGGANLGCNSYSIPGRWDYGVLVNFTDSVTLNLTDELRVTVNITIGEPANLHQNGGVIPLHYEFIDPIFSNDTSAAFYIPDDRYPYYLPYPWDSTNYFIANIEQIAVYDTVNALSWSTHDSFPMYKLYNVFSEPGDSINENGGCFNTTIKPCTMSVTLQVTPSSLVSERKRSDHGIDSVGIFIDEGAILGAVTFVAFFFSIYMV